MKVVLREDESGVSEVIGTILILAITVVLFSTIIIWVTNIPTPSAQIRLDIQSTLNPIYSAGVEVGVNITLLHQGGESLAPTPTLIYVTSQRGTNPAKTDIVKLHKYNGFLATPSGLLDGSDSTWNVGERWSYRNTTLRSTDSITILIVDTLKSVVLWSSGLNAPAGTRPPVFVDKWNDGIWSTDAIDPVVAGQGFFVFAKVQDPDGDLNNNSIYATITAWFNTGDPCAQPQKMRDDGVYPDHVAGDGIFSLGGLTCMKTPFPGLSWDGSIILLNATDKAGHAAQSRLILNVLPGGPGDNPLGRPANLRWNGRQGYNIFNSTSWDQFKYKATEARSFRASEEVVVVVASLGVENAFLSNQFTLYDPYSGAPAQAVVYGTNKAVTTTSFPSSAQAFTFMEFVNGYYVYTSRFKMNAPSDPTVGTNFYKVPAHPPSYFFTTYSLDVLMVSSSFNRFNTTDSISITDEAGYARDFPVVQTFKDSGFTTPTNTFKSTDMAYVQVRMFSLDATVANVIIGNVIVKDYSGNTQIMRAPLNGHDANLPICPIAGACAGTAVTIDAAHVAYRFALNFSRANQDSWGEGAQSYAFSLAGVKDTDESYASVSTQIVVVAPLYKLDIAAGTNKVVSTLYGTQDYSYYYENLNSLDRWRKSRVEYCGLIPASCVGVRTLAIAYIDFDRDGDLDIVSSLDPGTGNGQVVLDRRDLDSNGNVVFTRAVMENLAAGVYCNALAVGDVTGDGAAEVVCGGSNGNVWYYKNDGTWQPGPVPLSSKIFVDQSAVAPKNNPITSVTIADFNGDGANDIVVGGGGGRLTYYPNLDKLGKFQNAGVTDDWYAEGETTIKGNLTTGSYLNTFVSDDSWEQVSEGTYTEPAQFGGTTNAGLNASAPPWTYADWENGAQASGAYVAAGGNPGGLVNVQDNFLASQTVSGFWSQSFTVSGSSPFTATINFDRKVSAFGGSSVTVYAFVDPTNGNPVVGQAVASFTNNAVTGWISSGSITVPAARIPSVGTYYVKFAARTTNAGIGGTTTVQFDNIQLSWSSTGGPSSELEHYWRSTTLPNRPGTTYTFTIEAHHTTNSEGDNFAIAYSTNVVGNVPTTGTYTTMLWVNATSDQVYTFILPASVAGQKIWVRAVDMDHSVGNTAIDILFVDQMYVHAVTPSGTTGVSLTNPGDATQVNAIDSDDQNADRYFDLVVATATGRVFKYVGATTGLVTPSACFYAISGACGTAGTSIVGVKFGNFSTTQTGLEIALAFGTTVRILTGFGNSGTVIGSGITAANAITAFDVGDVNGDGADDVVVGTATDIWYWWNQGGALSWSGAIQVDSVGAQVYSIDLGDASKAQYIGR